MAKQKYCGIGGQAVMEGIMMKNANEYAIAVRKEDGTIVKTKAKTNSFSERHKFCKWPLIRGVVSFIESLVLGMGTLTWSANQIDIEEENEKKKKDEKDKKKDDWFSGGLMVITVILSLAIAIGVFMLLPAFISSILKNWIESEAVLAIFEGVFRVFLFVGYILLISLMKDIKRTFMYHGAEHKCINCIEHGLPLTVDNVLKSSKEHRRCGTSFLIIVMLISIIFFIIVSQFVHFDNRLAVILSRLLLVPVIAGVSYEILRFTGKHDNKFTYIISRPGMWMQGLTTKEPDAQMVEVAIVAVEEVFDWRSFLKENYPEVEIPETEPIANVTFEPMKKTDEK